MSKSTHEVACREKEPREAVRSMRPIVRQGAVSIKSAFQAKKWTDKTVSSEDIDKLRGAIQGDFDHGVFITTSRFSKPAVEVSYKKGAITILLLDGESVAELMLN